MRATVVLLLLVAAFAGCVSAPPLEIPPVDQLLTPATEPLWWNPQTEPHPAFNYPTLTRPAMGANVSQWWKPIPAAALPSHIAGLSHVADASKTTKGAGMSVFGSLAVVPSDDPNVPTHIVDISDPEHPTILSSLDKGEVHRNVDFIAYPNGRLVGVFAGGNDDAPIWDLTNPKHPERLGELKPASGTHKINIVPGTPIVYNAHSSGGKGGGVFGNTRTHDQAKAVTEIYDLSDPENPVQMPDFQNGYGCHHIYFWNNAKEDKYRALCAGIEVTQIWDTKDPRHPTLIVDVPMQHGNPDLPSTSLSYASFSHFSILNYAGTVLIAGDESGGGGLPPGCLAHAGTPVRDASTPVGALWFYDVKDEKHPKLLGWLSASEYLHQHQESLSCTAHHGRLVPDPEKRDLLAMAFYGAGVVLVDFTDPTAAKFVDQWNDHTDTWEVQYYNGYLFTGDLARGMDVLKFR